MKWYEVEEDTRIKDFYSKYSIKEFWDWWSDGSAWMELRTINWKIAKNIGQTFNLPYSQSGVFVNNASDLKAVIKAVRNSVVLWFGANPRKKNKTRWGKWGFGGGDNFIECVKFIFIDIDRKKKETFASLEELKMADNTADIILKALEKQGWNKSYLKLCSGNGVQLFIKLDVPFIMPKVTYEKIDKEYAYQTNEQFEQYKRIVQNAIGKPMMKFVSKLQLPIEVDKSAFRIAQVGALPFTKNFKYDGFRWRGIIEIQKGENSGLSDYLLSKKDDKEEYKKKQPFGGSPHALDPTHRLTESSFDNNRLVRFILDNDLPQGRRNNRIWLSMMCLVRDWNMGKSEAFKKFHKAVQMKWKRNLDPSYPAKKFRFNEQTVNNYCFDHMIPPLYDFRASLENRNYLISGVTYNWKRKTVWELQVREEDTIKEDFYECAMRMKPGDVENFKIVGEFISALEKKYGTEKTKYFIKYVFPVYFEYGI